ncbi:MAG: hypothetical protein C0467_06085 [Planctomycetaceae bacterium]|nr:hypothetical protein [Planctomycetaceae bacterium]
MTFPDGRTMTTLAAIVEATAFEIWDDDRMLVTTDRGKWEPLGDEIDELTERDWIRVGIDSLEVTEAGRYWLKRYETRKVTK